MAGNVQWSADYAVGPIVDAVEVLGDGTTRTVKVVLPGVILLGTDGDPVDSGAMAAAIGNPDDAAYTGTGDGTVISILKGIFANTAA